MNNDDIERLAKQAGLIGSNDWLLPDSAVFKLAVLVRASTIKEAAALCYAISDEGQFHDGAYECYLELNKPDADLVPPTYPKPPRSYLKPDGGAGEGVPPPPAGKAALPLESVLMRAGPRYFDMTMHNVLIDQEAFTVGHTLDAVPALVVIKKIPRHAGDHLPWLYAGSVELPKFDRTEHIIDITDKTVTVTGPFAKQGQFIIYLFGEQAAHNAIDAMNRGTHTVGSSEQNTMIWMKTRTEGGNT